MSFLYCFYEFFVILFWVFFILWVFCCLFWVFCYLFLSFFSLPTFSYNSMSFLTKFAKSLQKNCEFFVSYEFFCKCWDWSKVKTNWANQGTAKVSGNSNWVISVKKMVEIVDSSNFFSSSSSFISQKGQNRPVHASMCQFLPVHKKSSISFTCYLTIATVTEYNLQKYPF